MSVTTILFKKGATVPTGSNFAETVGEPLWHQDTGNSSDLGHLYVTNGTNNPTLIGPIDATQYIHPTFTIPTGSNYTVTAGTDGDQIVSAAANYAIGGFTVTSEGHVKEVSVVALPSHIKPDWNASAGADAEILNKPTIPSINVTDLLSTGNTVATITDGTSTWTIKAPQAGSPSVEELQATSVTGGFKTKTNNGGHWVHLVSGTGSTTTFTMTTPDSDNTVVTMDITVIDGGSW